MPFGPPEWTYRRHLPKPSATNHADSAPLIYLRIHTVPFLFDTED